MEQLRNIKKMNYQEVFIMIELKEDSFPYNSKSKWWYVILGAALISLALFWTSPLWDV